MLFVQEYLFIFLFLLFLNNDQKFQTDNMGLGIRTTRSFSEGEVVALYTGEFVSYTEADRREKIRKKNGVANCYMLTFALDGVNYWFAQDSSWPFLIFTFFFSALIDLLLAGCSVLLCFIIISMQYSIQ